MITAKSDMACSMCYIKNGIKLGGMGSMNLSNFDDLHIIRCKMTCRLHI